METYELSEADSKSDKPYTPEQLIKLAQSIVHKHLNLEPEIMEDLKIDFILAAYQAQAESEHKEGIRSYQYQAGIWAINKLLRWLNNRNKYEVLTFDEIYEYAPDEEETILRLITENESSRRIQEALENLPERTRQIIELHIMDDWTFERIGETLGIESSWVNRIYNKGLHLLGKELEDLYDLY